MTMVQGQQPQNGPVNANRFQQSPLALRDSQQMPFPQGLSQSSAEMFSDGIWWPSPHPGNPMQPGNGLGQSMEVPHPGFLGAGAAQPQNSEMQQRLHMLYTNVKSLEAQQAACVAQLANSRGNPTAESQRLNYIKGELAQKKGNYEQDERMVSFA